MNNGNVIYLPSLLLRYQAICHPLTLNSRTGVGRARRVIVIIWVTSIVSAYPWSIFAKVKQLARICKYMSEPDSCENERETSSYEIGLLGDLILLLEQ